MAKTKIKLTEINHQKIGWKGSMLERWFDEVLLLRHARNVGDEEVVNNYVLGQLNKYKEYNMINFIKI